MSSSLNTLIVHGDRARGLLLKATLFMVILSIFVGLLWIAMQYDKANQFGAFLIMGLSISNICACVCIWKLSDAFRDILKGIDELQRNQSNKAHLSR